MGSTVQAQLPVFPEVNLESSQLLDQNVTNPVVSGCVRLDGRCLFEIADRKSDLPERTAEIEQRLDKIAPFYFHNNNTQIDLSQQPAGEVTQIYLSVGEKEVRLTSVTEQDARLKEVDIATRADRIAQELRTGLRQAKRERQQDFLIAQAQQAAAVGTVMLLASLLVYLWGRRSKQSKQQLASSGDSLSNQPISTRLSQKQRLHLREVKHRLLQLAQAGIWLGGSFYIFSLFPYTRVVQVWLLSTLGIPLRLGIVCLATYVIIRCSYVLIDRFTFAIASNYLLTPEANWRLQLRVSTISGVAKGVATAAWVIVGVLVALAAIGVNIAPLLAGAGIIGVALSLASQNLIKDALNGFFIIVEDQYAVGDVIGVGEFSGLVENMNLRITQLRDAEGRLVTIPNSEIKMVANFSSNWSRADLKIPVAHQADVNKALALIDQVTQELSDDPDWRELILETPEVLGVDDFGEQGVIIRVWIKTQPIKQWEVSRECRRRIKAKLDEAEIQISVLRQEFWHNHALSEQRGATHSPEAFSNSGNANGNLTASEHKPHSQA